MRLEKSNKNNIKSNWIISFMHPSITAAACGKDAVGGGDRYKN